MSTENNAFLVLKNVSKRFGKAVVIDNLDLNIERGTMTTLLGPSGCGKTTILRAIAGLVELEDGSIRCHARRLAYLFQEPRLLPWLRADENVRLVVPEADTARIQTLFRELWLDDKDMRKIPARTLRRHATTRGAGTGTDYRARPAADG